MDVTPPSEALSIPDREVHQLRKGLRGAGGHTRAADHAKTWRCLLQDNTASARRLHWWSLPGEDGGVVEFASVGVHDEFGIPEYGGLRGARLGMRAADTRAALPCPASRPFIERRGSVAWALHAT